MYTLKEYESMYWSDQLTPTQKEEFIEKLLMMLGMYQELYGEYVEDGF